MIGFHWLVMELSTNNKTGGLLDYTQKLQFQLKEYSALISESNTHKKYIENIVY